MKWSSIPGIELCVSFHEIYLKEGLLTRMSILDNPNRQKFGYLWSVPPQIFGLPDPGHELHVIYIKNDIDARVALGYFNRTFFETFKRKLCNTVKDIGDDYRRWDIYLDEIKLLYRKVYLPFKKFIMQKDNYKSRLSKRG